MPLLVATIEGMERKLTLRDVVDSINNIVGILTDRINKVGEKVDAAEARTGSLESRFGEVESDIRMLDLKIDDSAHEIRSVKEKVGRTEFIVYNMQKDAEAFHGEMRGIHKVIDRFDQRITDLEVHAGFPTEAEDED